MTLKHRHVISKSTALTFAFLASTPVLWMGCTSSKAFGSSPVAVSGKLGASAAASSLGVSITEEKVTALTVDLSQYTVGCTTQSTPPVTATGSVNADGSFNISIPGATGQPMSCFLLDASGKKAADFLISDSSKKDMNGHSQTSSTVAFKGDAPLGDIAFDPNSGEVTVPAANIAGAVSAAPTTAGGVFDPSGSWTIADVDFTLPAGMSGTCAQDSRTCNGPPSGVSLYLNMISGTQTSDSSAIQGLQVWQGGQSSTGLASYNSCGSKIGLSSAQESNMGISFAGNPADGVFTFPDVLTAFNDRAASTVHDLHLTDHWKITEATTMHDVYPCGSHPITIAGTTYASYRCGPVAAKYQISLSGGCTADATHAAVDVRDWSGITTCSNTIDSNGIRSNSCTGHANVDGASTAVTCENSYVIANVSDAIDTDGTHSFNFGGMTPLAAGQSCSLVADPIQKLQCYAEYYENSGARNAANACLPRVDMDWSATSAADFVSVNFRPNSLVFMEQYLPFPDGSGGSIMTRQEGWNGVQVSANNWVNCRVIETGALKLRKVSDSKLLAVYQSSSITTSKSKPACVAAFKGDRSAFMFYLNK
jgi:hypothetical protein